MHLRCATMHENGSQANFEKAGSICDFHSREALASFKPKTFLRWHRQAYCLLWRWKSRPRGQPRIPGDLQRLIAAMAKNNPTWGEERIAAELLLKLGIHISPSTARRYMPDDSGSRHGPASQGWMTFVRNHAQAILACEIGPAARESS